jgi:nucleoside-diphosphate-sugar epimerase
MKSIAFIGATSQIAKDLISALASDEVYSLSLFSRRPEELREWLHRESISGEIVSLPYGQFIDGNFDAIINCVGSGDPARTAGMAGSILDVTYQFDSLALDYVRQHPGCRYIFLSSGAAYGSIFRAPAEFGTNAEFRINSLAVDEFYSLAKMHAECRHRAIPDGDIVDIRIFNYCSATTDLNSRFLTSYILRAIHEGKVLSISADSMYRDFITPVDFSALVRCVLNGPAANRAIDVYSRAPVEKFELLDHLGKIFDFRYEIASSLDLVISTGAKPMYYSKNRSAGDLGYQPQYSSSEGVALEIGKALKNLKKDF